MVKEKVAKELEAFVRHLEMGHARRARHHLKKYYKQVYPELNPVAPVTASEHANEDTQARLTERFPFHQALRIQMDPTGAHSSNFELLGKLAEVVPVIELEQNCRYPKKKPIEVINDFINENKGSTKERVSARKLLNTLLARHRQAILNADAAHDSSPQSSMRSDDDSDDSLSSQLSSFTSSSQESDSTSSAPPLYRLADSSESSDLSSDSEESPPSYHKAMTYSQAREEAEKKRDDSDDKEETETNDPTTPGGP